MTRTRQLTPAETRLYFGLYLALAHIFAAIFVGWIWTAASASLAFTTGRGNWTPQEPPRIPPTSPTTKHESVKPDSPITSDLYEITAYSHGCTLPRSGVEPVAARTASGLWPIVGETVAADPAHAFGREVLIEGLGYWTVHDRGLAIVGRRLDLFLNTCKEARAFGRQWRHVYLVPDETTQEAYSR